MQAQVESFQKLLLQVLICLILCDSMDLATGFYIPGRLANLSTNQNHAIHASSSHGDDNTAFPDFSCGDTNSRRQFLSNIRKVFLSGTTISYSLISSPFSSHANGLLRFPCEAPLKNIYHLMRAGTNLLEQEDDIWSTNPLFLTNREAALSDVGIQQTLHAAEVLQQAGVQPSVVRHSLAAASMDAANIIRDQLKIGQNRINPEFVYMDPRAIGRWDMMSYQQTYPAIVALDELEAGEEGRGGRPPANDDGTPHETLFDQSTRLRQLMSALETQYSGDTVLLVFPDATGPALLSAMMAGIPFNQVHLLDFQPGEVRLDVTRKSTLNLLQVKQLERQQQQRNQTDGKVDRYSLTVQNGQSELKRLRSLDETTILSKRDEMIEQERLAMDEDQRFKAEARHRQEEEAQLARMQRQRQIEESRIQKRLLGAGTDDATYGNLQKGTVMSTVLSSLIICGGVATLLGMPVGAVEESDVMTGNNVTDYSDAYGISPAAISMPTPSLPDATNSALTSSSMASISPSTILPINQSPCQGDNPIAGLPPPRPQTVSEEDRIKAARIAMEEYISRDDGANDWLSMMGAIIEEDDDDNSQGAD